MAVLSLPYRAPTAADFMRAMVARERQLEERSRDPDVQAVVAQARSQALAVATMLRERFGATRVRLFGSLARGDTGEDFDIDLAVEGIPSRQFFAAWGAAASLVTRKLDLIDVGTAPPLLRRRIEQDGVDL